MSLLFLLIIKLINETHFSWLEYRGKIKNDPTSYGNDIFVSNTGDSDYGIEMFQGVKPIYISQNLLFLIYLIQKTNLKLEMGLINRMLNDEYEKVKQILFSLKLKTDLFNRYYDF